MPPQKALSPLSQLSNSFAEPLSFSSSSRRSTKDMNMENPHREMRNKTERPPSRFICLLCRTKKKSESSIFKREKRTSSLYLVVIQSAARLGCSTADRRCSAIPDATCEGSPRCSGESEEFSILSWGSTVRMPLHKASSAECGNLPSCGTNSITPPAAAARSDASVLQRE